MSSIKKIKSSKIKGLDDSVYGTKNARAQTEMSVLRYLLIQDLSHMAFIALRRLLIVLITSFCLACVLYAGSAEALRLKTNWGERVDLSEKIVKGRVVALKSYWNPEKTLIYTNVTVLVDEYLKGNGLREIILKIPGGTVGDKTQWVSDAPQFRVGNYAVILLESSGQITGGPDGVYLLKREEGDRFLFWLRAYIAGDPKASKEGPASPPGIQQK